MLTSKELGALVRNLEDTRVLSVYVDARVTDPAMRNSWRPAHVAAVRAARATVADGPERAELERALAALDEPLPALGGTWGAPGCVGFLTASGPAHTAVLPVRVPTLAVWRRGPFVSPYIRALAQHRPVIVAAVDSRSASFYRYFRGELTAFPHLNLSTGEERENGAPSAGARRLSRPGPRLALGTDWRSHRREVMFRRLATDVANRLAMLAGPDGWILIGGTPEWAQLARDAVPGHLLRRTVVSPTLDHDASAAEIACEARRAARRLRETKHRALLHGVLEQAGALGRGAAGVPDTQRALRSEAVELLVVTDAFLEQDPELAELMVRDALRQGAEVDVVSGEAADRLDRQADGIAARLRFAPDVQERTSVVPAAIA